MLVITALAQGHMPKLGLYFHKKAMEYQDLYPYTGRLWDSLTVTFSQEGWRTPLEHLSLHETARAILSPGKEQGLPTQSHTWRPRASMGPKIIKF